MVKLKKILAILLIFMMMFQVVYAADTTIDTTKKGSITIYVLQDRNGDIVKDDGSIVGSEGTGESGQSYSTDLTPLKDVKVELYLVGENDSLAEAMGKANTENLKGTDTSGTDGKIAFNNLELGRYLVKPIEFPENVHIDLDAFLVDVPSLSANKESWNYDVVIYPKVQTVYASIVLNLKDENGDPLPNGKFEIYKKNEETNEYEKYSVEEFTTNDKGQIVIDNLPFGEYELIERGAPDGHGTNKSPIEYKVTGKTDKERGQQ